MVEPHAVLEVPDSILHLGVAAMVGFQCAPLPVGDEGVIAVAGEEGQRNRGWVSPAGRLSRTGAASGSWNMEAHTALHPRGRPVRR